MSLRTIFIIILTLRCCYNSNLPSDYLDFPDNMKQEIKEQIKSDKFFVYYLEGECSICYGLIATISKMYPALPIVSISGFENEVFVDYTLKQIDFHGVSLIDSDSLFYKTNYHILETKKLFLMNIDNEILFGSRDFDRTAIKQINALLN